jgi:hypothetical protein
LHILSCKLCFSSCPFINWLVCILIIEVYVLGSIYIPDKNSLIYHTCTYICIYTHVIIYIHFVYTHVYIIYIIYMREREGEFGLYLAILFWDRVFMWNPGWPWTIDPPASASWGLGLQA